MMIMTELQIIDAFPFDPRSRYRRRWAWEITLMMMTIMMALDQLDDLPLTPQRV